MSGGHYDYVFYKIDDIRLENVNTDPRRASFQKLLTLVAKAMRSIEYVDSGDSSPGDEHKDIDAVFSFLSDSPETIIEARAYSTLMSHLSEITRRLQTKGDLLA